ncbi:hypothetical protein ACJRO7_022948 [Eucalyptus globulus]|uniref:Uncharacterized protein n=1 Tax=Eucalyptus globulus TaxID=34317 RepID=A0ABD3K6Y3_EUCGL
MNSFELPSFSLGLDSDSDPEPPIPDPPRNATHGGASPAGGGGEELEPRVEEPGRRDDGADPPRALKRLRRGLPAEPNRSSARPSPDACVDDDIEEFSSDETCKDEMTSIQIHSVGSSSKVPLCGRWVNNAPSSSRFKANKGEQASIDHSASLKRSFDTTMSKQTTLSPLRRFHLIDSDSDSPSTSEHANEEADKAELSSKEKSEIANHTFGSQESRKFPSYCIPENEDLWRDFRPTKSFHIPTPALDEVCEEYFHSVKRGNKPQQRAAHLNVDNKSCQLTRNSSQTIEPCCDSNDNLPPSHRYFFNDDPSIRNLVHSRLPHFFPLGGANSSKQPSLIDYMGQFANGESSKKQAIQKNDSKKSSRGRNKSKAHIADEITSTGSWMNPKATSTAPQNAGKRRVLANGKSAGHWYTAAGGKKVYVTATGEELTGRGAYGHYRKENGMASGKSRKKSKGKKGKKGKKG